MTQHTSSKSASLISGSGSLMAVILSPAPALDQRKTLSFFTARQAGRQASSRASHPAADAATSKNQNFAILSRLGETK